MSKKEKIFTFLGKEPDKKIAEKYNCSVGYVILLRLKNRIPPFRELDHKNRISILIEFLKKNSEISSIREIILNLKFRFINKQLLTQEFIKNLCKENNLIIKFKKCGNGKNRNRSK